MKALHLCLGLTVAIGVAAPVIAQDAPTKIDKALIQSLAAGCGTEQVIIRTKRGYRAGLLQSLEAHGDRVAAEHPAIDAVTAEVHCDDLATVARFDAVLSISQDSVVQAYSQWTDGPHARSKRPNVALTAAERKALSARKSSIAPPKRDARETRRGRPDRIDADEQDYALDGAGQGTAAELAQDSLFETLGIKQFRWSSQTSPAAVLSDFNGDGSHDFGNALFRPSHGTAPAIAVIDSGIEPSAEFERRITHFYDFTSGKPRKARPSDTYGHGTHVAGLIAGRFVGIAPETRLVGLKVLDSQGRGLTSHVIRAIEFATANKDALGLRAINISLGHPVFEPAATDPLVQAVENAVRAGLVVITAAGNYGINPRTGEPGYAGMFSPGNAPSALTVGALQTFGTASRRDDRVAPYSSRGPSWFDAFAKPDVVAPGHSMLSVAARGSRLRKEHEKRGGSGDYMRLSGTSMAAGTASGIVGLMLRANPGLTPNALKMVLEFSSIPVGDANGNPYDALSQGTGAINGGGALKLALSIDPGQPVGGKWLTVGMPFTTTIAGQTLAWSQMMIWGPHRVFGDGIVDENRIAWGTAVAWGDGLDGDNIVWGTVFDAGDNIVWGTNFLWSAAFEDNIVWGTFFDDDNIVWGTNIVWGNALIGVLVGDNIVWGTLRLEDNIVWGTMTADNIVWGTLFDDNIVWGTVRGELGILDNIVWGTGVIWGDLVIAGVRPSDGRTRGNVSKY